MSDLLSLPEFAAAIDRSHTFVRRAVILKKIKAQKAGYIYVFNSDQVEKFKKNPFQISAEEVKKHLGG